MSGPSLRAACAFPLLLAALLPAQGLRFQTEQHAAGGCLSQALTIMHLETSPQLASGGQVLTVEVHDTVPGEQVLLWFGSSYPYLGPSYLPVFTHGPYLAGPEFFGPWCGWYCNGGVWGWERASAGTTTFRVQLPMVPSTAFLGDFLWCQAMMSDPTPGWRQGYVTSRPIRLRVVA
jgi:hypothetical protein